MLIFKKIYIRRKIIYSNKTIHVSRCSYLFLKNKSKSVKVNFLRHEQIKRGSNSTIDLRYYTYM